MSFYIILDTLQEITSNEKLPRLRWEYEAQNDILPIPSSGKWSDLAHSFKVSR